MSSLFRSPLRARRTSARPTSTSPSAGGPCSPESTSWPPPVTGSPWSARTAAARPRCCGCWPVSCRPTGEVRRAGSLGVADQQLPLDAAATVGDLIDLELAAVRGVLADLDLATDALAEDLPGAADAFASALAEAEALDAWDADRRVEVSLAALNAVDDRPGRSAPCRSGSGTGSGSPACSAPGIPCCCWTSRPTTSTRAASTTSPTGCAPTPAWSCWSATTGRCSPTWPPPWWTSTRPATAGHGCTAAYAAYVEGRRAERARWEALHADQLAERQRLADDLSSAQNRLRDNWRPDKGHGKHTRATRAPGLVRAVHRRQEELESHVVAVPQPPARFTMPELPEHRGATLLRADGVTVAGRLERPVDLALDSGERLVVTGPNGAGKSTLLAVLAGALAPDTGTVTRARPVRIGWLGQESDPPGRRTAKELYDEHVARSGLPRRGWAACSTDTTSTGRWPSCRSVPGGGWTSRWYWRRPHVLLFDEPTNHLSATLVDELTAALERRRPQSSSPPMTGSCCGTRSPGLGSPCDPGRARQRGRARPTPGAWPARLIVRFPWRICCVSTGCRILRPRWPTVPRCATRGRRRFARRRRDISPTSGRRTCPWARPFLVEQGKGNGGTKTVTTLRGCDTPRPVQRRTTAPVTTSQAARGPRTRTRRA